MDEDGIVEEVLDDYGDHGGAGSSNFLVNLFDMVGPNFPQVVTNLQTYGWFLVIFIFLAYYIKSKIGSLPRPQATTEKVDENEALERMERIEAARRRQQEALEAAKAKFLAEKKAKEEQAALEKAQEWERHKQGLGYKNKSKAGGDEDELAKLGLSANNALKKKPRLRDDDYNPLLGASSGPSCSFRSSRPGPRAGG